MKRKLFLSIVLCLALAFVLVACDGDEPDDDIIIDFDPDATYTVDFADGNIDFLMLNVGTPGTDPDSTMSLATLDDEPALRLTAPDGKNVRLGINVDGLLGSDVVNVRTIIFDVYAQYPDGNFSAVSGRFITLNEDLMITGESNWQIYLKTRNPNPAVFTLGENSFFSEDGNNLLEFAWLVNGPADRGEAPAVLYIKNMTFFNENNVAIELNTESLWSAPEGYGEAPQLAGWDLPLPDEFGWFQYVTPGVDGETRDILPWYIVNASFGLVVELAEKPESFEIAFHGHWDWSWVQVELIDYWDDEIGGINVLWSDIGFDPKIVTEENYAFKIYLGNWEGSAFEFIRVYLMVDDDVLAQHS
ncbi:MAG: hypothetical protein LBC73_00350 [Oscillospiraceae bacterium]|nr:hypothetical protein [Oscillospiraceae bacterium]